MKINKKYIDLVVIIFSFLLIICCINNQYEDEKELNKVYVVEGLSQKNKKFLFNGAVIIIGVFLLMLPIISGLRIIALFLNSD
jgi:hypothetical protein